jgi:hypothetical protein
MGFFAPAEKLKDPIAISATTGNHQDIVIGPCSAFRVTRASTSAGKLRFLARDALTTASATAGYELTADSPDSGWIFADKTTHLRIYADGGNVAGQVWATERA